MSTKLRSFCANCVIAALLLATSDGSAAASGPKRAPDAPHVDRSEATYRGGLVTPPLAKPQFTLTDTSGTPFDFRLETQGYVTLLFFGYTHCPDECPLHMAAIATSLQQVPEYVRNQVKVVFVTADPARDTSTVLRAWLNHFDRRFIGLTGNAATIEAAQRAAQVPAASKTVLANRAYEVGHASFVLAYTKDNLAHVIYPGGITPTDWAHDLPLLVKEVWSNH
jgi:protein SCO1/2